MLDTEFSFDARPVDITNIEIWRDGGTVSLVFVDAEKFHLPCFVGGKLRTDAGQLFVGDAGVSHDRAELISPDEAIYKQAVFAIESHLIYQVGTPDQQRDFESAGFVRDDIIVEEGQGRELWLLALALGLLAKAR